MHCPACQQPLHETAPACAACGFSLAACDAAFGAPPLVEHPVTDPARRLSRGSRAKIAAAAAEFSQRFPQTAVTVLLAAKPAAASAKPWLFWMFNRSGLHSPLEKGGACRRFLLWIDPESRSLAAICGYGFEPLLPAQDLQEALTAAAAHAAAAQYARAAVTFIRELGHGLTRLHLSLPRAFGWSQDAVWFPLEDAAVSDDAAEPQDAFAY